MAMKWLHFFIALSDLVLYYYPGLNQIRELKVMLHETIRNDNF